MAAIGQSLTNFELALTMASEAKNIAAPQRLALFICRHIEQVAFTTHKPTLGEIATLYDTLNAIFDKMVVEQNKTTPTTIASLKIHWSIESGRSSRLAKIVEQWVAKSTAERQVAAQPPLSTDWDLGVNCRFTVQDGVARFQNDLIDNDGSLRIEESGHSLADVIQLCRDGQWPVVRGQLLQHQGAVPNEIGQELLCMKAVACEREHCKELIEAGVILQETPFITMLQTWDALDLLDIVKTANPTFNLREVATHLASRYKEKKITPAERHLFDAICRFYQDEFEFHKTVFVEASALGCNSHTMRQLALRLWIVARNSPRRDEVLQLLEIDRVPENAALDDNYKELLRSAYHGQISDRNILRITHILKKRCEYAIETINAFKGNIDVDDLLVLELDDRHHNVSRMKNAYGEQLSVENLFKILASHHNQYLSRELAWFQRRILSVDELMRILDVAENLYFLNRIMSECKNAIPFNTLYFLCEQQAKYCKYPVAFCHIVEQCLDGASQELKIGQILPNIEVVLTQAATEGENIFSYSKNTLIAFIREMKSPLAKDLLTQFGSVVIQMIEKLKPDFVATEAGLVIFKKLASSIDPLLAIEALRVGCNPDSAVAYSELVAKSPLRLQLEQAITGFTILSLKTLYSNIALLTQDEVDVAILQILSGDA